METRIEDLPNAPLPFDTQSYIEVEVVDPSSATGYTSCKVKAIDFFTNSTALQYKISISQASTSNPTKTVHVNTLPSVPSITRISTGIYDIVCTGNFGASAVKCWWSVANSKTNNDIILEWIDINTIRIKTYDYTNVLSDDIMDNAKILIEIY